MPDLSAPVRQQLLTLLEDFGNLAATTEVRERVIALIPAFHALRKLGTTLVPEAATAGARERILTYFLKYPRAIIHTDELMVVSGISDYPRRIRELRVERGWHLLGGVTARRMYEAGELDLPGVSAQDIAVMGPDDYVLLSEVQDRDAAHRWRLANSIRRRTELSGRDRMLAYLLENVGRQVSGEELDYVAKISDWPRRCRELRTEEGWQMMTRNSGRPDLPVGMYLLESAEQALPHDRRIPDSVRVEVLQRDDNRCRKCQWTYTEQSPSDPRRLLELHHLDYHSHGGANNTANLITLCNVHHDDVHREHMSGADVLAWVE